MIVKDLNLSSLELSALLSQLQLQDGFIYLDSASSHHNNNRFSIIAWQPLYSIETCSQTTTVSKHDQVIESTNADPLDVVKTYLQKANIQEQQDLPFSGGAIGYFDYELGGRFESLPAPKQDEIYLPNMYVGIYDSAIVLDHINNKIQLIVPESSLNDRILQINSAVSHFISNNNFKLLSEWSANMTKTEYKKKFETVQNYLRTGDCYQINLAQRFHATYQGDEWQAYQVLRTENAAPFSSFIRIKQGVVLSVSPERFIEVKDKVIETKPIKGTRPRSDDPKVDQIMADELRSATKDRAENLMIVDLLRNDLSKVAVPGSVDVPKLFDIESFPAVHHLVSTIKAKLATPYHSIDLLRGAFPGGSITGAPKIRAMQIINELEPNRRSVYCGAIGYITPNGNMDTNITIRTLVCCANKIYCWAGGGLVADSKWHEEYQETLDKVNRILPVLSRINQ